MFKIGDYFIGQNCISKCEATGPEGYMLVNILNPNQYALMPEDRLQGDIYGWRKSNMAKMIRLLYV